MTIFLVELTDVFGAVWFGEGTVAVGFFEESGADISGPISKYKVMFFLGFYNFRFDNDFFFFWEATKVR